MSLYNQRFYGEGKIKHNWINCSLYEMQNEKMRRFFR